MQDYQENAETESLLQTTALWYLNLLAFFRHSRLVIIPDLSLAASSAQNMSSDICMVLFLHRFRNLIKYQPLRKPPGTSYLKQQSLPLHSIHGPHKFSVSSYAYHVQPLNYVFIYPFAYCLLFSQSVISIRTGDLVSLS